MKYFYHDTKENNEPEDRPCDFNRAIEVFYHLSDTKGSFFGLKNDTGQVVQFAWESDDVWQVDIPDTQKNGSYTGLWNYEQCVSYMSDFFLEKNITKIKDLKFETW